jgi:hypothetical protein
MKYESLIKTPSRKNSGAQTEKEPAFEKGG